MTAQNLTTRAPIAVILADLLVLQSQRNLPAWLSVNVADEAPVSIECASGVDLLTWHEVLGGEDMRRHSRALAGGGSSHIGLVERLGWVLSLRANDPAPFPVPVPLPVETVSALAGIAATADADAAAIVAEVFAPRLWRDNQEDVWAEVGNGRLRLDAVTTDGSQLVRSREHVERDFGPLVEVTDAPKAVPSADAPVRGALVRAGAVLCETCGGCAPEHRRGCPHRHQLTPPVWDEQGREIRYDLDDNGDPLPKCWSPYRCSCPKCGVQS